MKIGRRLRTRVVSKELMLQICIESCVEFFPSLHLLNDPISPSHPNSIPPTFVTECSSGRSLNFSFSLSPLETSNHHIGPNESGSLLNEHNEGSSVKSNFFLNWM